MATARTSFPLDFDLIDGNEEQVIFITDDVTGQEMFLEITNTSNEPFSPQTLSGAASENNHHFELVFRPGSIFNNPNAVALQSGPFEMFANKDGDGKIVPNADGTLSMYFKATGAWTLNEGEKVVLHLNFIRAEAAGGTRSTRVMLRYQNLLHAGASDPFSGFRETHVNIVNHQGRRRIPLHVGFLGSGTVLNDGVTRNTLRMRLTNVSRDNNTLEALPNSVLTLAFDGGPLSREWALATDANIANFIVKATYPGQAPLEMAKSAGVNEWRIPFRELAPDQYIELEISEILTDHPTGHTNLYMVHENIPGYWDSQHVCVVEKGPLAMRNNEVGIGTLPEGKLHIVNQNQDGNGDTLILGPTSQSNLRLGYHQNYSWIQSQGSKPLALNPAGNKVAIGDTASDAHLTVRRQGNTAGVEILSTTNGNTHLPFSDNWNYVAGNGTIFRDRSNNEKMRIDVNSGKVGIGKSAEGGVLSMQVPSSTAGLEVISPTAGNTHLPFSNNWNYLSGHGVIFRNKANHEVMRLDAETRELGIGTGDPHGKVHIVHSNQDPNGGALIIGPTSSANLRMGHNSTYSWIQSHGSKPLSINAIGNNVGIGTNSPQAKLDVNGNVRANALNVNSGTQFNKIQAGHHRCGSHGGGVKEVRINFPQAFVNQPMCQVTVRNEGYHADTFAVTVKYIDRTHFKVNILRSDSHRSGWGQNVRIDWIAYEVNGMVSQ